MKTVVRINIFVETVILWWIEGSREKNTFEKDLELTLVTSIDFILVKNIFSFRKKLYILEIKLYIL